MSRPGIDRVFERRLARRTVNDLAAGTFSFTAIATVEAYTIASNTWTTAAPMPQEEPDRTRPGCGRDAASNTGLRA